jgi:AcrR family transcriptional regulator
LLAAAGPAHVDQVTTRAVCEAAGVTAPTLYHHFGDKDGLVAAVVARTAADVLATKGAVRLSRDPVADVRRGWDAWVAFALAHPALFALVVASPRAAPEATAGGYARLGALLARVEAAGRLAVPLPLALDAVWAAAQGVTALLVQRAYADRPLDDVPRVSAALRDAVLAAVTTA